jgi:glycosyltransferase involved in cell wall biosynthesis
VKPKPRVAVVAASLDILGGQGVQADRLVDALAGDGYEVTFVPINPRFPSWIASLREVRFVRTSINQLLYLPSLMRLSSVDIVHAFSASYWSFLLAPVPAMIAARSLNKRVVLHYHSGEADDHLSNWGSLVHPWLRLAHEIVVPSEYLRTVFARHGYNVRVIPNVVDVSRFSFRDRRPLRPRLLSARNLERGYRVDVVLEAFARFKAAVPDARLTVAGYGSEERSLRRLAGTLVGDGVQFVGKVEPERMPALYEEADVFVNASVVDNQPVSIIEALSAGLPVVSTPTGDIRFMLQDGDAGVLVPPDDPPAMAHALLALWRDPDRARHLARRARCDVAKYTWPAVRDQWAEAYTCR